MDTITAGSASYGTWTTPWTAVQRGTSGVPGYNATPPAQWLLPQRMILTAGAVVGIRATCFAGSGPMTVTFSLDDGPLLTVTAPTKETHAHGTDIGYWFTLPSGLSAGGHEIRTRVQPAVGLDRVLQNSGDVYRFQSHQLTFFIDTSNRYCVVAVGGTASGQAGVKTGTSIASTTPQSEAYPNLWVATNALMSSGSSQGATVYVRAGAWESLTSEDLTNQHWLIIKRHPSEIKADVILTHAPNDGSSTVTARWVKYQGFTITLSNSDRPIFYQSNHVYGIWIDDCNIIGQGQFVSSGGFVVNNANKVCWSTRNTYTGIRGYSGKAPFIMHFYDTIVNCTGDIFTDCLFNVKNTVSNHKSLGNAWNAVNPGTGDGEHGDLWQKRGSNDGLMLCENDVGCNRQETDGTGTSIFQVENGSGDSRNMLVENNRLKGFEPGNAPFSFCGLNPIGVLLRNNTVESSPFDPWSSSEQGTLEACEVVNNIWLNGTSEPRFGDAVTKLLSTVSSAQNGRYSGNHNIQNSITHASDTTGTPALSTNGIPTQGGNLQGRTRVTLGDAGGNLRAASTYAGAYAAVSEYSVSVVEPPAILLLATIVESGRAFLLTVPSGLTCRYTTTGVDPTISTGTAYSSPIPLTANITFTIRNFDGSEPSVTTTAAYQVITNGTPAPPRIA